MGSGKREEAAGSRKKGVARGWEARGAREAPAGSDDVMRRALRARRGEAYERGRLQREDEGRKGRARERGSRALKADGGGRRVRVGRSCGHRGGHRAVTARGSQGTAGGLEAPGGSCSGCAERLVRLQALSLVRAGAAGCLRDGRGRASGAGRGSGLLLSHEALLFGMDARLERLRRSTDELSGDTGCASFGRGCCWGELEGKVRGDDVGPGGSRRFWRHRVPPRRNRLNVAGIGRPEVVAPSRGNE